jgi:hypothetical protein
MSEDFQGNYGKFPPLQANYLNIAAVKQSEVLLYQKVGAVATNKPLVAMGLMDNQSIGLVFAENIWKWKMIDFKNFKNLENGPPKTFCNHRCRMERRSNRSSF